MGLFPDAGVFCVSDGMGGGDDGEVASEATIKAVEEFCAAYPQSRKKPYSAESFAKGLCVALNGASAWIYHRAQGQHLKGCGATFVGVCFDPAKPEEAVALHAGDSRLYRIRGREIQQITKDHSAAELIGAKDEKDMNPMFRGMILRAVGIQASVDVETTPLPLKKGDRLLVCSDGLSKMVADSKILSISRANAKPSAAVEALIDAAKSAGGVDNVTVAVVDVGPLPTPLPAFDLPAEAFVPKTPPNVEGVDDSFTGDSGTRDSLTSTDGVMGEVAFATRVTDVIDTQTDDSCTGVTMTDATMTDATMTDGSTFTSTTATFTRDTVDQGDPSFEQSQTLDAQTKQNVGAEKRNAMVWAVVIALLLLVLIGVLWGGLNGGSDKPAPVKPKSAANAAANVATNTAAASDTAADAKRPVNDAEELAKERQRFKVERIAMEKKLAEEDARAEVERKRKDAEKHTNVPKPVDE